MITAKDIMSPVWNTAAARPLKYVESGLPIVDVLPRLLDTPDLLLGVKENGEMLGVVDRDSMLAGMGRMIAARDDCSIITLECGAADYSASRISRAVEDTDAHLVDMWTVPAADGRLSVTLRVRREDPTQTVHSLERYGYEVVSASGKEYADSEAAAMRFLELKTFLNV